jgi:hypothetical protein
MAGFEIHDAGDGPPIAHAVHGEAQAIDGRADDAVWARAPKVTFDTDWSGKHTTTTTTVRFAWSKGALAALFEVDGTDLLTDTTRPTDVDRARLYDEDCVEIFLGSPLAAPRRYFEIEVGPYGHFLDLDVGGPTGTEWSSGLRVGTTRDAGSRHATIEIALTSPDVTHMLAQGAGVRLGLFRMEGAKNRQYLAWSPTRTTKPNFHVPEALGTLVLDP